MTTLIGGVAGSTAAGHGPPSLFTVAHAQAAQVIEDAQRRVVVLGSGVDPDPRAFVARFDRRGTPDRRFGNAGVVRWSASRSLGWVIGAVRADGGMVVAGTTRYGAIDERGILHVDALDARGRPVRSFGHDGDVALDEPQCLRGPTGIALQGHEIVLAALRWCSFNDPQSIVLVRLRANGALDASFGTSGSVIVGSTAIRNFPSSPLLSLSGGRTAVASSPQFGTLQVTQLLGDGTPAPHFGVRGVTRTGVGSGDQPVDVHSLLIGKARILTAAGCSQQGPYLARFNVDGSPYRFWAPNGAPTNVESLGGTLGTGCGYFTAARNGDFVGAGRAVVWFLPNGLADLSRETGHLPTGATAVSIAASRDGSVLVASKRGGTTFVSRFR
jgi:hypothetical protein